MQNPVNNTLACHPAVILFCVGSCEVVSNPFVVRSLCTERMSYKSAISGLYHRVRLVSNVNKNLPAIGRCGRCRAGCASVLAYSNTHALERLHSTRAMRYK